MARSNGETAGSGRLEHILTHGLEVGMLLVYLAALFSVLL